MTNILEKLFGRSKIDEPAVKPEPEVTALEKKDTTLPINDDMFDGEELAAIIAQPEYPHIVVGCAQSVGLQRDHNEDALFAMSTSLVSNRVGIPMGLFIVADGMGGHEHGELASELAIQAMVSSVLPEITPPALGLVPRMQEEQLQEIMSNGVQSAHKSIQENASGGGSTLTGLLILGKTVTIAHIGDSRAYHFDGQNTPQVLTTDHSLVKRLEDLGQITADEAAIHPQRNVLYRALGQVEQVDADIVSITLPSSGYLVVCSDGLWGLVSDQEISRIILSADDPQQASQSLLEAANAAGGPDNISVIIIQIPG